MATNNINQYSINRVEGDRINRTSRNSRTSSSNSTNSTNSTNRTKKNVNSQNSIITSIQIYEQLYILLSEIYRNKGKQFTQEEYNIMLNRFFNNNSSYVSRDTIIRFLESYKQNVVISQLMINQKLSQGQYNFYEIDLHGGFPEIDLYSSFHKSDFKQEIVPPNVVICFLTPLNRIGYNCYFNKKQILNPTNKNNKENNSHSTTKFLKNLLCFDKFTTEKNNSAFNNKLIPNVMFRDAQIYLPNQIYPDLILSSGTNKFADSVIYNGEKKILKDIRTNLSNFINETILGKSDNIHYFFIHSCRSFFTIKQSYLTIYKHEFLTYTLNLMLSNCNKNLQSGFYKPFAKEYPKMSTLNELTTGTMPIRLFYTTINQILDLILTYNNEIKIIFSKHTSGKINFKPFIKKLLNDLHPLNFLIKHFYFEPYCVYAIIRYVLSIYQNKQRPNPYKPHITEDNSNGTLILEELLKNEYHLNAKLKNLYKLYNFLNELYENTETNKNATETNKNATETNKNATINNLEENKNLQTKYGKKILSLFNKILQIFIDVYKLKEPIIPKEMKKDFLFLIYFYRKIQSRMQPGMEIHMLPDLQIIDILKMLENSLYFPIILFCLVYPEYKLNNIEDKKFNNKFIKNIHTGFEKTKITKNIVSFGRDARNMSRTLILERAKTQLFQQ